MLQAQSCAESDCALSRSVSDSGCRSLVAAWIAFAAPLRSSPLRRQEKAMRNTGRNGFMITFVLTVLTAAVMAGAAGPAHADDCLALE